MSRALPQFCWNRNIACIAALHILGDPAAGYSRVVGITVIAWNTAVAPSSWFWLANGLARYSQLPGAPSEVPVRGLLPVFASQGARNRTFGLRQSLADSGLAALERTTATSGQTQCGPFATTTSPMSRTFATVKPHPGTLIVPLVETPRRDRRSQQVTRLLRCRNVGRCRRRNLMLRSRFETPAAIISPPLTKRWRYWRRIPTPLPESARRDCTPARPEPRKASAASGDLFHRRASLERPFDVAARAGCIHVGVGCIESHAQQFDLLRRERTARVNAEPCGHELVRPFRIEIDERIPRLVPLVSGLHTVALRGRCRGLSVAGFTPNALASSSRIGAP